MSILTFSQQRSFVVPSRRPRNTGQLAQTIWGVPPGGPLADGFFNAAFVPILAKFKHLLHSHQAQWQYDETIAEYGTKASRAATTAAVREVPLLPVDPEQQEENTDATFGFVVRDQ